MSDVTTRPDKPGFRFNPRAAAGRFGAIALAGVGMWRLFLVLSSLDNSPEEFQRIGTPLFAGAVACFVACVTAAKLTLPESKATLVFAALAVVCWIAPVPFGITRLLSYGCIGMIIARHIVGVLASCFLPQIPDKADDPKLIRLQREGRRNGWMCALGVVCGGVCLLMLIKADALGWAAAID